MRNAGQAGDEVMPRPPFKRGEKVRKVGGDYSFTGWIVARWQKRRAPYPWRVAVENRQGLTHIFNEKQLRRVKERGR